MADGEGKSVKENLKSMTDSSKPSLNQPTTAATSNWYHDTLRSVIVQVAQLCELGIREHLQEALDLCTVFMRNTIVSPRRIETKTTKQKISKKKDEDDAKPDTIQNLVLLYRLYKQELCTHHPKWKKEVDVLVSLENVRVDILSQLQNYADAWLSVGALYPTTEIHSKTTTTTTTTPTKLAIDIRLVRLTMWTATREAERNPLYALGLLAAVFQNSIQVFGTLDYQELTTLLQLARSLVADLRRRLVVCTAFSSSKVAPLSSNRTTSWAMLFATKKVGGKKTKEDGKKKTSSATVSSSSFSSSSSSSFLQQERLMLTSHLVDDIQTFVSELDQLQLDTIVSDNLSNTIDANEISTLFSFFTNHFDPRLLVRMNSPMVPVTACEIQSWGCMDATVFCGWARFVFSGQFHPNQNRYEPRDTAAVLHLLTSKLHAYGCEQDETRHMTKNIPPNPFSSPSPSPPPPMVTLPDYIPWYRFPWIWEVLWYRACTLAILGRFEEAKHEAVLLHVQNYWPHQYFGWALRARIEFEAKNYTTAHRYYSRAAKLKGGMNQFKGGMLLCEFHITSLSSSSLSSSSSPVVEATPQLSAPKTVEPTYTLNEPIRSSHRVWKARVDNIPSHKSLLSPSKKSIGKMPVSFSESPPPPPSLLPPPPPPPPPLSVPPPLYLPSNDPVLQQLAEDRGREKKEREQKWAAATGTKLVATCMSRQCPKTDRCIFDSDFYYQLQCSVGCRLMYHKVCRPIVSDYDAPCQSLHCHGRVESLESFERNKHDKVVHRHLFPRPLSSSSPPPSSSSSSRGFTLVSANRDTNLLTDTALSSSAPTNRNNNNPTHDAMLPTDNIKSVENDDDTTLKRQLVVLPRTWQSIDLARDVSKKKKKADAGEKKKKKKKHNKLVLRHEIHLRNKRLEIETKQRHEQLLRQQAALQKQCTEETEKKTKKLVLVPLVTINDEIEEEEGKEEDKQEGKEPQEKKKKKCMKNRPVSLREFQCQSLLVDEFEKRNQNRMKQKNEQPDADPLFM